MIILHAGFEAGELLLWGEKPSEIESTARAKRGRKSSISQAKPFPYEVSIKDLLAALADTALNISAHQLTSEAAAVWLPSVDGQAVASSRLIAEQPEAGARTLERWKVSALRLPVSLAVDLLCSCVGRETLAPGIIIGKDLAFWATSMR